MDLETLKKRILGSIGELIAAACLVLTGHRILARNWRCRRGELDIVALRGKVVVFAEVRTRRRGALVDSLRSVDPLKMTRTMAAARVYLAANGLSGMRCRFDIFALTVSYYVFFRIRHIKAAFDGTTPDVKAMAPRRRDWSRR